MAVPFSKRFPINSGYREGLNCGSFAFNVDRWYRPYPCEFASFYSVFKLYGKNTIYFLREHILKEFPNVRLIQKEEDLQKKETLVLLRISSEYDLDFHFIKKQKNNCYYHKRGSMEYIERISKKEVYSPCWCGMYTGEIILFAQRED